MTIKKLNNGNYQVDVCYPKVVREILGIETKRYRKNFSNISKATDEEKKVLDNIEKVIDENNGRALELNAHIKFKDFYENIWMDYYKTGSSGRSRQVPSDITINNTKDLFRLHILPMLGGYSIKYLNDNKNIVLQELNKKSLKYANIKIIKSYIDQIFNIAELLDYIEVNRISKIMRYVGDPKKQQLKMKRQLQGESMTAEQLLDWIDAVNSDFEKGNMILQDYILFMLTLNIGDRKSESYALRWNDVDLDNGYILLVHNLNKMGELTSTKSNKQTKIQLSIFLIDLLSNWKKEQKCELQKLDIKQTSSQFLFTYINKKGELNQPVHIDYLNYRMNSIHKRHPKIIKTNPHKLRHTFSTLAREGGATMAEISSALTHSDIKTTETYVNTPTIVDLSTYNKFSKRLNQVRKFQ